MLTKRSPEALLDGRITSHFSLFKTNIYFKDCLPLYKRKTAIFKDSL